MIRLIIADDEKLAREKLIRQLSRCENVDVVGIAKDGKEAVRLVDDLKPDLVILDINMPKMSGMKVLEQFKFLPKIIFATAYDEYAIEAFEKAAIDYLLKPYTLSRLQNSLLRVSNKVKEDCEKNQFQNNYEENDINSVRLTSKIGDKTTLIKINDIAAIKSESGISWAFVIQPNSTHFKDFPLDDSLDELIKKLPNSFVRVHRNAIVNTRQIQRIEKWFNSNLLIKFSDSDLSIATSRSGTQRIRSAINL